MKITYIHQHFKRPDEAGGGRPFEFAKRLAASGHQVTMISAGPSRDSYRVGDFDVEQVATKYDNTMSVPRRLVSFGKFMLQATAVAARQPADVVLASSTPLTVAIPGMTAALLRRARFVLEVRDLWPRVPIELGYLPAPLQPVARMLERLAYARADTVIALSPWMAEGVRETNSTVPVRMIPNASDVAAAPSADRQTLRRRLGVQQDELLLYYAGSLGMGYDPEWLTRLAVAVQPSNARLIVAGAGAGLDPARRALEAQGIPGDSVFVGPLPRSQVRDLAAAADLAVSSLIDHPSLAHNSLNKVFDAMAAARPVLFNHGGWLSDLLQAEGAGWQCPRDITAETFAHLRAGWTPDALTSAAQRSADLGRQRFDRDMLYIDFEAAVTGKAAS
ncbi:glycosyltransferase family 4 protein [Barrientosiimonas humi]|nr:glycosyltransferase family 4 protein [Barrientosiimonas humi]